MKKIFFYGIIMHIKALIICAIPLIGFIRDWNKPPPESAMWWVSPQFMVVITILIYINCLSIRYIADEEGLRGWSFIYPKKEPIKWNEITHIEMWPRENTSWLFKFLPVRIFWRIVFGHTFDIRAEGQYKKTKEIFVISGMRNYKELLRMVIDKCKDNSDILIDTKVLEIVNRTCNS